MYSYYHEEEENIDPYVRIRIQEAVVPPQASASVITIHLQSWRTTMLTLATIIPLVTI